MHTTFLHDWFPNATLTSHLLHVVIRNSSHDVQTHTLFKRILIYFRRTFVDFSSLKTQIEVQSLFIKEVVDDPECMHCINMREFLRTWEKCMWKHETQPKASCTGLHSQVLIQLSNVKQQAHAGLNSWLIAACIIHVTLWSMCTIEAVCSMEI